MKNRGTAFLFLLLVLAQSGLGVGHCHDVDCGSPNTGLKHVHMDSLFHWDGDAPCSHDDPDAHHSHDEWSVAAPGPMAFDAPAASFSPSASLMALEPTLLPADLTNAAPQLLGLPPPHAGPERPLFLTHCSLRI